MPELPEVETVHRSIAAILPARIKDIFIHNPKLRFPLSRKQLLALKGQTLQKGFRRAKYIILPSGLTQTTTPLEPLQPSLNSQIALVIHLGMTGRVHIVPKNQPITKYTCVEFHLSRSEQKIVYSDVRRFGFLLVGKLSSIRALHKLGPEPLLEEFSTRYLYAQSKVSKRSIKHLIMDQSIVAGLGNIYASESLFLAGVHPQSPASSLDNKNIARLRNSIRRVLRRAIAKEGSSFSDFVKTDGSQGGYQNCFLVYQQTNQPCKNCLQLIQKVIQDGRSSFFCPDCQPAHKAAGPGHAAEAESQLNRELAQQKKDEIDLLESV